MLSGQDLSICYVNSHVLQEAAESVKQDFGSIDILVHSLANGPEVNTAFASKY